MKKEFDQIKYINDYNKKNYKAIQFRLKLEEKEELDTLMKKNNIVSYRELILKIIEYMKSKKI